MEALKAIDGESSVDFKAKNLGRFIVADPRICHGKPTFRGTRIMVRDVLDDVAQGVAWESILERWGHKITRNAIREAVELANEALFSHIDDFILNETIFNETVV